MTSRRSSAFAGFRFPREVIAIAVLSCLRYGPSYRDVEELLVERGIRVDHVTVYWLVQRFTSEFIEAARPCRRLPSDRWSVDETYVRVAGRWTYLYRAIDQHGQVIDVMVSVRRDLAAARRLFTRALAVGVRPVEVTTDRAPAYPRGARPTATEADHSRLKARLRPMRRLQRLRSAQAASAGHAFVQNLRRGYYKIATDEDLADRVRMTFEHLTCVL